MTIQTNVLESWLGRLDMRARQLRTRQTMPSEGSLEDGRVWFEKPEVVDFWRALDGLDAELNRVLRQMGTLQVRLDAMAARLEAAPREQRPSEQSRIDSFENDLARVANKAASLASRLLELRRHGGGAVSETDLAQAIHHIGTQFGQPIDALLLRRTVRHVSTTPAYSPSTLLNGVALGGLVETLFVLIAMVSALAKKRRA